MGKKHRSRVPMPQELAALEKEHQKLTDLEKQIKVLNTDRTIKWHAPAWLMILFIGALVGFKQLCLYYHHHNNRWFLIVVSATMAAVGSGYLVYCAIAKRAYDGGINVGGFIISRGEWIYRDEDKFLYWAYMVFFLFWDGVAVYALLALLIKGSV